MLLHICCAPCSTHVVDVLKKEYNLTGFFYNPNIHPDDEYLKRKAELERYSKAIGIDIICGEYEKKLWLDMAKGMEDMPEGGERCSMCFRMRLDKTAEYAKEQGYNVIATTLSISPHKNASKINQIGRAIAEKHRISFYEADFKKRGGFEKSISMSRDFGLYRQSYCGCIFSKVEAEKRSRKKVSDKP